MSFPTEIETKDTMATFENPGARDSFHNDKVVISLSGEYLSNENHKSSQVFTDHEVLEFPQNASSSRDCKKDFVVVDTRADKNGHVSSIKDPDDLDYSSGEDDDDFQDTCCTRCTTRTQDALFACFTSTRTIIKYIVLALVGAAFGAYFIYACYTSVTGALALIVMTFIVLTVVLAMVVHKHFGKTMNQCCCKPCARRCSPCWRYLRWVLYFSVVLGIVIFITVDVREDPRRLTSLSGLVLLIGIGFLFSKHPSKIKWRPVIWGLLLQWVFGLLVLRWSYGLYAVEWFARQVVKFLEYSDQGSAFVFGESFKDHQFAMQSLPVVVFFSAVISILYYIGFMQFIVKGMAWTMQVTMGTTAIESLASASNIFVSYVEVAPILIPYVSKLTRSELHAILTSGFATVAGSILALYISFGAPAPHLVSACILSAPAALAMAKLSYPETKRSRTKTQKDVEIPEGKERNFIEAAANGAMMAVKLVGGIAACLIAFLGIVGFVNGFLGWVGGMVGVEDLSFKLICSYLLWPFAILMGVEVQDAKKVAGMLGWKIFVDEVLCYRDLGEAVSAGELQTRSAVIATYACCGFGSLGAMGVALGAMLAITPPNRRGVITQLVVRALINGNIAAFMTACVAGLLYKESDFSYYQNDAVETTTNATCLFTSPYTGAC